MGAEASCRDMNSPTYSKAHLPKQYYGENNISFNSKKSKKSSLSPFRVDSRKFTKSGDLPPSVRGIEKFTKSSYSGQNVSRIPECVNSLLFDDEDLFCDPKNGRQQDDISVKKVVSIEKSKIPVAVPYPFEDVLFRFYMDRILTDVVLQTSSESFSVHKLVLCCRSAVFSAMFTQNLNGRTGDVFDITEDADTMRRLLLYIYTNEVQCLGWESAADLLKAADKYELLDLKEKCSAILKTKISRESFCGVLSFADMYDQTELLNAIFNFISQTPAIFNTEEWKKFKKVNPELALETTERIINNFQNFWS